MMDKSKQNMLAKNEARLQLEKYKTCITAKGQIFTRKLYSVDVDFNNEEKLKIFSHGLNSDKPYKIWFLNTKGKLCVVDYTQLVEDVIYVKMTIDARSCRTKTGMSLDRFLYLIEAGEFTITNKKFCSRYLKPFEKSKYYKAWN